jgi:hypothetical protein
MSEKSQEQRKKFVFVGSLPLRVGDPAFFPVGKKKKKVV